MEIPEELRVQDFVVPAYLKPASFTPHRVALGVVKRLYAKLVVG